MSTLYRDYRPQNFQEILGQNHIKITLQNEIAADKLAQAFLFCGPRAVGKTTLARVLAKSANCLERKVPDYEPCNRCSNCLNTMLGKNLDVVEIDAASNTGVDNVRENIISFSRLTPSNSPFKVFIIDEVHMLSVSAFNALLKIIEEPPKHVIFILCTTEIQKVPATIISRCERFDFKRISVVDVVKKLSLISATENITVAAEVLEAIARRSGGHLRDAESLLGQVFALGGKKISLEQAELIIPQYNSNEAVDLLEYLSLKDAAKAISLVNKLADTGANLKSFTGELISLLRKIMLNKVNPGLTDSLALNLGDSLELRISAISSNLDWEKIIIFLERFLLAHNDHQNAIVPQLFLEMAIVDLCYTAKKVAAEPRLSPLITSSVSPSLSERDINNQNKIPPMQKQGQEAPSPIINSDKIINLEASAVFDKWPEFLVKIKKYNHSLSFIMQNCQPDGINNNVLRLVFKYKFHQDRVNDQSVKPLVENTLTEIFGAHIKIDSVINENLQINKLDDIESKRPEADSLKIEESGNHDQPLASGSLVNNLLKTFGGEIIN